MIEFTLRPIDAYAVVQLPRRLIVDARALGKSYATTVWGRASAVHFPCEHPSAGRVPPAVPEKCCSRVALSDRVPPRTAVRRAKLSESTTRTRTPLSRTER